MDWLSDLRYACRLFRKTPLFTLIAIGTLALGIGANTVMFSVVDAVVIRALPYDDPDRVVMIWEDASRIGFPRNTPAPANFADWRRMNRSFDDIAATRGNSASLTGDGQPEQVLGRGVTPNFFSVLGVRPQRGRTFTEDEDRTNAQVVVISYGLWQRRYGGDPSIVGRTVLMNDNKYEVIGVMPRPFVFRTREIDYWVPIRLTPAQAADRGSHYLNVVGRLKAGVTLESAREDMHAVARRLTEQYPGSNRNVGSTLVPMKEEMLGNTGLELLVLMGAAIAVLLIACANLASLLMSRAAGRRGELAVRAALGATRGRLTRQLLLEGLVLSLAGGGGGLALVPAARQLLVSLTPMGVAALTTSVVDLRLLSFTLTLAIATGLIFSAAPALQAGAASLGPPSRKRFGVSRRSSLGMFASGGGAALHDQARSSVGAGSRLTRDALVILQIAAAAVLLVATGLMIRTLVNLRAIDVGFRTERLLTMRTTLPRPKYTDPSARLAFYERVLEGVRKLPGIEHAAFASNPPFTAQGNTTWFKIDGIPVSPDRQNDAMFRSGTTDYLSLLGVRPLEGRLIDDRDGPGSERVVVINETMARQYFPNQSPLGHRVQFSQSSSPFHTIVGVVRDVRERGYELELRAGVYLSIAQSPEIWAVPEFLVVRTTARPEDLTESVRHIIAGVDPAQPISAVRTMDDIMDLEVADRHQQMVLLGGFAALAIVVASIGLYGLLAFGVAQRSREIGLRMALGATPRTVVMMIAARGLALAAIGLGVGVAGGWATTRAMSAVLYGVRPNDPSTYLLVVLTLGVVSMIACVVPAVRAARVDPMQVLRQE